MIVCMPQVPTVVLLLPVVAGALALPANAQTCGADPEGPSPQTARRSPVRVSSSPVEASSSRTDFRRPVTQASAPTISPKQRSDSESPGRPSFASPPPTTSSMTTPPPDSPAELGDVSIGFKQQLGPTLGGFDVSLVPSVSLPPERTWYPVTAMTRPSSCPVPVPCQRTGPSPECSPSCGRPRDRGEI